MRKLFIWISYLSIASSVITLVLVIYWLAFQESPLLFNTKTFKVLTPVVKQGETLRYVSDYCKKKDYTFIVTRTFENSIIYVNPSFVSKRDVGCNKVEIGVQIPNELPPGKYNIKVTYQTNINPIRVETVVQKSDKFTVIKK